jgi:hypothetical protein
MINLIGCYYQEQMTPDNDNFDNSYDIQVITKDTLYNVKAYDYYYENDHLFAKVTKQVDKRTKLKLNIQIPADEIETIEAEKTDVGLSILATLGVLTGLFAVVIIIGLSSSPWGF